MNSRINICIIIFVFTISLVYAQSNAKAATQSTWHVAGMFSAHYRLPIEEEGYTEDGVFALNINPRIMWFPIDGLGVGAVADFRYYSGNFSDLSIGIGPHVAYFLKDSRLSSKLMPYTGCSFQYLMKEMIPGAIETGWNLKFGVGISQIFGEHVAVPIELGYMINNISSDYGGESFSQTINRIYLECGIGAFLWK